MEQNEQKMLMKMYNLVVALKRVQLLVYLQRWLLLRNRVQQQEALSLHIQQLGRCTHQDVREEHATQNEGVTGNVIIDSLIDWLIH